MLASLAAAWLVASQDRRRRSWGFWVFMGSNVLWVAWGWHTQAHALIALQVGLFVLNVRGAGKNEAGPDSAAHAPTDFRSRPP
ncbi:hypothetical protein A4W93_06920 [Piscinibacter gummiphilus]|uniref:Amino acid transporter n=2 Tax=Piscinibacter gummiphilus TaxID=946333 RepID=A0A1W6LHP1_9BURK|nr:hypothetical protein [Piscinibacter gummiphilus]ARN23765.1 hypothetical protein A4W93_06920 [Piscinibacter gummiphilus]ATU68448.1 hypothetical protein CPZ87_07000 [Piscinibacter gummiphilus]